MSSNTHEIVILGGNFGGIGSAHYILRHTIPALAAKDPNQKYRVTLVSPSTHFFFKIAAPRVLISPDKIPLAKALVPIQEAFSTYEPSQFTFVQGLATGVDPDSKTVTVKLSESDTERHVPYSSLIIAVGNKADPLWALNEAHTVTENAHRELQRTLPNAKTILIAGGGAAGVETAGEIGENFPNADTTILSGGERLLPRIHPGSSSTAENKLKKMGVKVFHNLKVVSTVKEEDGKTRVNLSDGNQKIVDVYINATGGKPNTDFLPPSWLDANRKVSVDGETLRGKASGMEGIYSIGDAASYSTANAVDVKFGVKPLCTSLGIDLAAQLASNEKSQSSGSQKTPKALTQVKYKGMKDTQVAPIGSKGGIFQIFGWRLPSFFCWLVKSRDFMIGNAVKGLHGADYVKP